MRLLLTVLSECECNLWWLLKGRFLYKPHVFQEVVYRLGCVMETLSGPSVVSVSVSFTPEQQCELMCAVEWLEWGWVRQLEGLLVLDGLKGQWWPQVLVNERLERVALIASE